jgi:uncharacterized membrane protein
MLSRAWTAQGVVSGLSAAIGYLLGTLAGYGVEAGLHVHHASDPVGNATVEAFWRRPEWTDRPQGYDIPARAG